MVLIMNETKPSVVKVVTRQVADGPYLNAKVTLSDGSVMQLENVYVFQNEKRESKYPNLTAVLREVAAKDHGNRIARNQNGSVFYTGK